MTDLMTIKGACVAIPKHTCSAHGKIPFTTKAKHNIFNLRKSRPQNPRADDGGEQKAPPVTGRCPLATSVQCRTGSDRHTKDKSRNWARGPHESSNWLGKQQARLCTERCAPEFKQDRQSVCEITRQDGRTKRHRAFIYQQTPLT